MKTYSLLLLAIAVVGNGCREAGPKSVESDEDALAPRFSAKQGLLLPETTRQSLGLQIVEVSEQAINASLDLPVRLFERTRAGARASSFVSPEEAKALQAGQPVEIRPSEGRTLTGKIASVNEQMEKLGGQVEALMEFYDPDKILPLGQFLKATVALPCSPKAMTIPRSALLECSEGTFVYSVSGEYLVRTAIKVGAMNSERVEILDGLYAGDQVVSQPVLSLWLTELAAVKGGQACCVELPKGK